MPKLPKILASTWDNGVFVLDDSGIRQELPNQPVQGLSSDLKGGATASVGGNSLYRRDADGSWNLLARHDHTISTTFTNNQGTFVGTDDACVLALTQNGDLKQIDNFDSIAGRDQWFAGTAIIDGKVLGPPLGVRSLHGASSELLLANVHVGGIPRSVDGGNTWTPTIDVSFDAHEVHVDNNNANLVVAATAVGLCMSHDGGDTWSLHTQGLHSEYCSAVTISGQSVFVAASESHFSPQGAIYRRSTNPGVETLEKVEGGLPNWLEGIADTSCIAAKYNQMVIISAMGSVYVSSDAGQKWVELEETVPGVSSVLIVD